MDTPENTEPTGELLRVDPPPTCSRSSDTPETDGVLAMEDRGSGWLVAGRLEEHARKMERELNRYKDREKHCETMDKAEKLALIYAIQEIGDVVCLNGLSSSPAQIVAAVKNLHANAKCAGTDASAPRS